MRASAAAERGLILQLKGTGYLIYIILMESINEEMKIAHDPRPLVTSAVNLMIFPCSSTGGSMLYTDRTKAMKMNNE